MARRTASRAPEVIELSLTDRRPIVTVMRRLARERDGWVNLEPAVDPDDLPPAPSGLTALVGAKGRQVPLASWVPGTRRRNGTVEPVSLGLQHAGGPRAVARLRDAGLGLPAGWRVLADHPRRGLVLAVPDDEDPDRAVDWVLRAAIELTPFELPPQWWAVVFPAG